MPTRGIVLKGEKVRDVRKRCGWTQTCFATRAGLALDVIKSAESNKSIRLFSAQMLAKTRALSLQDLVASQVDSNIMAEGQEAAQRHIELTREHLQEFILKRFSQDFGEQFVSQDLAKDEAVARAEFLFYQIWQLSDGNLMFDPAPPTALTP